MKEGFGRAARGSEERGGCVLSSGRGRDPPTREPPQDCWLELAGLTRACFLFSLSLSLYLPSPQTSFAGVRTHWGDAKSIRTPHTQHRNPYPLVKLSFGLLVFAGQRTHTFCLLPWGTAAIALPQTAQMTTSILREVRQCMVFIEQLMKEVMGDAS